VVSSKGLVTLTQAQLDVWVIQAQTQIQGGRLPNYIPLLGGADSTWFAVQIRGIEGQILSAGDITLSFIVSADECDQAVCAAVFIRTVGSKNGILSGWHGAFGRTV